MLSRLRRIPFKRCFSTASPPPPSMSRRLGLGLAVSAIAGSYVTWQLNHVALDADTEATSKGNTKPPTPSNAPAKSAPAHSEGGTRRPSPSTTQEPTAPTPIDSLPPPDSDSASESESDDSEESSGGAFNPTTGEINWDCPCLGGMAHGPCGLQFREAFSCFVFSEQEPKGIDCVEKFKAMQDCFREHPDVYAEELMDDEEEEAAGDANTPGDEVPPTQDGDPHPAGALSSTTSPATTTPSSSPEISSSVNTKTRPKKVD